MTDEEKQKTEQLLKVNIKKSLLFNNKLLRSKLNNVLVAVVRSVY